MRLLIALATAAAAFATNISVASARTVDSKKAALAAYIPASIIARRNQQTGKLEYAQLPKRLSSKPSKERIAALEFRARPQAKRAAADELGASASSFFFNAPTWGGYGFGLPSYSYGSYSYQYTQVSQFSYGGYDYGCFNSPYAGGGYGGYGDDYGYGDGYY